VLIFGNAVCNAGLSEAHNNQSSHKREETVNKKSKWKKSNPTAPVGSVSSV
jgi:hypothetical protein